MIIKVLFAIETGRSAGRILRFLAGSIHSFLVQQRVQPVGSWFVQLGVDTRNLTSFDRLTRSVLDSVKRRHGYHRALQEDSRPIGSHFWFMIWSIEWFWQRTRQEGVVRPTELNRRMEKDRFSLFDRNRRENTHRVATNIHVKVVLSSSNVQSFLLASPSVPTGSGLSGTGALSSGLNWVPLIVCYICLL